MNALVLFAGMGGSTGGMARAGIAPTLAVDGWGTACGVHARWHDTIDVMCAPIERVHEAVPGPFDFVWASPSCKPWSTANRTPLRGLAHPEYYSLAHLVAQAFDHWGARVLVIENVCGLLWSREGKVECAELQAAANARGLYATWTIVRSSDLGVRQLRQRPICVVARESVVLPEIVPPSARGTLSRHAVMAGESEGWYVRQAYVGATLRGRIVLGNGEGKGRVQAKGHTGAGSGTPMPCSRSTVTLRRGWNARSRRTRVGPVDPRSARRTSSALSPALPARVTTLARRSRNTTRAARSRSAPTCNAYRWRRSRA